MWFSCVLGGYCVALEPTHTCIVADVILLKNVTIHQGYSHTMWRPIRITHVKPIMCCAVSGWNPTKTIDANLGTTDNHLYQVCIQLKTQWIDPITGKHFHSLNLQYYLHIRFFLGFSRTWHISYSAKHQNTDCSTCTHCTLWSSERNIYVRSTHYHFNGHVMNLKQLLLKKRPQNDGNDYTNALK